MLIFIICLLVFLDQLFKYLITVNISYGESVEVIKGFFYLTHHKNPGAAFSFLADQTWGIYVLSAFSLVLLVTMLYFLFAYRKKASFLLLLDVAVLAAGNAGNLIDRIRLKGVIDFLMFDFRIFIFPTFNLADSCVVVGAIGLLLLVFFKKDLFISEKETIEEENPAEPTFSIQPENEEDLKNEKEEAPV